MNVIVKWLLGLTMVGLLAAGLGAWWFANKVSKQPRAWRAEAVVEISAPPNLLFEEIADLRRWSNWSGWSRDLDPDVHRSYSGAPSGAGAVLTWDAGGPNPKVSVSGPLKVGVEVGPKTPAMSIGKGTVRIVSADADKGLELETVHQQALWLASTTKEGTSVTQQSALHTQLNGVDFVVTGRMTTEPSLTGTRVRWVEEGTFGDTFAGGMLSMAMRDMVEASHTRILSTSLDGLKKRMEGPR